LRQFVETSPHLVLPDRLLAGQHDLPQQPESVFQGSPVVIRPLVGAVLQELIDEVPVCRVDLLDKGWSGSVGGGLRRRIQRYETRGRYYSPGHLNGDGPRLCKFGFEYISWHHCPLQSPIRTVRGGRRLGGRERRIHGATNDG